MCVRVCLLCGRRVCEIVSGFVQRSKQRTKISFQLAIGRDHRRQKEAEEEMGNAVASPPLTRSDLANYCREGVKAAAFVHFLVTHKMVV